MYKCFIKNIIDFIIALLFMPFVVIAIMIFGPIIYLTDKGPIFFNANRTGKMCKQFKMYKLRTMYVNAPDLRNSDGSTFNADNDPRVTSIGRFLRKTSIDEIPQLFNVLKGDMSLVGPRPTVDEQSVTVDHFHGDERMRYTVKPGITGYAQAFFRNSITQEEKYRYDAYYAENISFFLDIKIIMKTIASVLLRENINTN